MRISIIGTGNVGSALGRSFVRAGHDVAISGRDAAKTAAVAVSIGATAAASPVAAASSSDVIVLAVPFSSLADVAADLAPAAAGKIVIDTTNPLKPDFSGLATGADASAAEQVAAALPGARVVKAFNTLFSALQADPASFGTTLDALIAADDEAARAVVVELVTSVGFRPVVVGPLAAARELEALAWLNIGLQLRSGGDWRSTFVLVGAPAGAIAA